MKDKAQRLIQEAMARVDGWENNGVGIYHKKWYDEKLDFHFHHVACIGGRKEDEEAMGIGGEAMRSLPAYLTSDDPIDRMVRGLGESTLRKYQDELVIILTNLAGCHIAYWEIHKATTAQKVEAYLKATGLWTKEME